MPRTYVRKPNSGRLNYSQEDMLRALMDLERENLTVRQAAERHHVPFASLHRRRHGKALNPGQLGKGTALMPNEEIAIAQNIATLGDYGLAFDTTELRKFIKDHLDKHCRTVSVFKDNKPGKDWATGFLQRQSAIITPRQCQNISRKRAAVSEEMVRNYFEQLAVTVEGVDPGNILNYDETNLTDDPKTKMMIFRKATKHPERIMNTTKSSTSIMFAITASGTSLPTFVVYKAQRVQDAWKDGGPLSTKYSCSKSGWFDSEIFVDWFKRVVLPWAARRGRDATKVVIGDNLASHMSLEVVTMCEDNNIRFSFLPPNSTHLLQPLDVVVFAPLKSAWRKILTDWKMGDGRLMTTLPKWVFPRLLLQLEEAMVHKWERLSHSAFRACGIYPLDADHVIARMTHTTDADLSNRDDVSDDLVQYLKSTREASVAHQKPRRKRVNVSPGAAVTLAYLAESQQPSTSTPKRRCREEEAEEEDEIEEGLTSDEEQQQQEEEEEEEEREEEWNVESLQRNDYVLVSFGEGKKMVHYVGHLLGKKYGGWEANFYRKTESDKAELGVTLFKLPEIEDRSVLDFSSIVKKLKLKQTIKSKVGFRTANLGNLVVR